MARPHRGGEQERVLQRNPAQIAFQAIIIVRLLCFTLRLHLVIQPVDQILDRHFPWSNAAHLARRVAGQARIVLRQPQGRALLVSEPYAAQQARGRKPLAGVVTARAGAQGAADHFASPDDGFVLDHTTQPPLSDHWLTADSQSAIPRSSRPGSRRINVVVFFIAVVLLYIYHAVLTTSRSWFLSSWPSLKMYSMDVVMPFSTASARSSSAPVRSRRGPP